MNSVDIPYLTRTGAKLGDATCIGSFLIEFWHSIDGLVQYSSNSIASALELLQSCTKPLI